MDFCSIMVKLLSSSFSLSTPRSDWVVPSRSLPSGHNTGSNTLTNTHTHTHLCLCQQSNGSNLQPDVLLLGLQLQHHLLELHLLLLQNLVQTLQLLQDTQRPTLINELTGFTSARGSDGVMLYI